MEIFSSYSTTAEPLLTERQKEKSTSVEAYLRANGITFHRTTCTDDQLVAGLIDELERRGVDLRDEQQHVVLIGEWDTFYGRALPLTFVGGHSMALADLNHVRWVSHCRDLVQLPAAA